MIEYFTEYAFYMSDSLLQHNCNNYTVILCSKVGILLLEHKYTFNCKQNVECIS